MRSFTKPAIGLKGLLFALIAGGMLTACTPDPVAPEGKAKVKIIKTQSEEAPPRGNNGGGGG